MPAYRYVLFPRGRQPTTDEVRQLHTFDGVLARRYAFGTDARDGRLAIAFDQAVFDYALATERGFEELLSKWTARGCELLEHLAFIKDSAALRPVPVAALAPVRPRVHSASDDRSAAATAGSEPSPDRILSAKELLTHEAIARSALALDRTLGRVAAVQRFAAAMPYLLIGLGTVAMLSAGLYISHRLQSGESERREQTISRVLDDPMQSQLDPQGRPGP